MVKVLVIFLLKILILLIFFINPPRVNASDSFVSVVNPIRGDDFWDVPNQRPQDGVKGQSDILRKFNISATWLLRFDALDNPNILEIIKERTDDEKGLFMEVTPAWSKKAGVVYQTSESWHLAQSALLTGYETDEREKFIDAAFDTFKNVFGYYPKSVGAWWIDSYSLNFMQTKYGITSAMIVSDQYTTDNYQIWGQYFSTPYYPAKNNAIHPAQNLDDKIPIVITQWAARDPINAYGNGVSESTYSIQANDYRDFHNLDIKYFSRLLDIYTIQPLNNFSHVVVGLENSYSFEKYKKEYENQIKTLSEKKNLGQFEVVPLKNFASWYISSFPNLSPEHLILADDPLGTYKKAVWFMNPLYRAGWFYGEDGSVFRDIRQYAGGDEEPCFRTRCDEINFATFPARVLDNVTYGHKWVIDEGKISQFKVVGENGNFEIKYLNEALNERRIKFLQRDISIDGKTSSVDAAILEATEKNIQINSDLLKKIDPNFFQWSTGGISESIRFFIFLFLAILIPGFIFTKSILDKEHPFYLRMFISVASGLVVFSLAFYILGLLKLQSFIAFYILIAAVLFIRLRIYKLLKFKFVKFQDWFNIAVFGMVVGGSLFQIIPTFRSGLHYGYGMGFWGPNAHDGIWHISLINQLTKSVPPQNPVLGGEVLKNYHYFYDLLVAVTNYVSGIPILDLTFRFYPITFSILLGIGTYCLVKYFFKIQEKLAILFSIYLVYFAGSFGWIVEYLKVKHLGGESAFWANQSVSFNLNPPFAVSLLIVIAILLLLPNLKSKLSVLIVSLLAGSLIAFKAYGAILILVSFISAGILKRNLHYILVFLLSSFLSGILFLSNFNFGQKLIIFSPFWFIHSMIDSPDRVGWARLSLARVAGAEQGNWFKFTVAEAVSFLIFLVGNLGTRAFALLALLKIKYIVRRAEYLFIFMFSTLAFIIPVLFIQVGNPWNTIQFIYYYLYISALLGGIVFAKFVIQLPKIIAIISALIFLTITPINSWATANAYLSYNPHAFISKAELEALEFLRTQSEGITLTYPYDAKLKNKIAEPWPIFAYDSTAYVSALSGKQVFIEDEPQNQILLTDYKKRLVASKDFFSSRDVEASGDFLKTNSIKYIYINKIYNISLDQKKPINQIFENTEIIIYEVIK